MSEIEVMKRLAFKVFVNTSCKGHYPVGFAAVVVAEDVDMAALRLNEELAKRGLEKTAEAKDMREISLSGVGVDILMDGNY